MGHIGDFRLVERLADPPRLHAPRLGGRAGVVDE
jgi:hypothetical protein